MTFVEISGLADQITELSALEAARRPVDFRDGTGPGLIDENPRKRLTEGTIECSIMRDDEIGRLDKGIQPSGVDNVPRDHLICYTCQAGDVGRDSDRRLLKSAIDTCHITKLSIVVEGEGDHANFDDLVGAIVQACGLCIENDPWRGNSGRGRVTVGRG